MCEAERLERGHCLETIGEVQARKFKRVALFVVSDIEFKAGRARGRRMWIESPWRLDDYSGKQPDTVDRKTGDVIDVELFVAALGASNYMRRGHAHPAESSPRSGPLTTECPPPEAGRRARSPPSISRGE